MLKIKEVYRRENWSAKIRYIVLLNKVELFSGKTLKEAQDFINDYSPTGRVEVFAENPVVDKIPYRQLVGAGVAGGEVFGWPSTIEPQPILDFLAYFGVSFADAQEVIEGGMQDVEISLYVRDKRRGFTRFGQTDFYGLTELNDTIVLPSLLPQGSGSEFEFRATYNAENKTIKITDNHSVGNTYGSVYGIRLKNAYVEKVSVDSDELRQLIADTKQELGSQIDALKNAKPNFYRFWVDKTHIQRIAAGSYMATVDSGNCKVVKGIASAAPIEQIRLNPKEPQTYCIVTNKIGKEDGSNSRDASYLVRFEASVDESGKLSIKASSRTSGDLRYFASSKTIYPIIGHRYDQVADGVNWGGAEEGTISVSTDLFMEDD